MDQQLNQLVERLRKAYGDRLVSLVLYGSGAAGDYHSKFSDLNILCVLSQITPSELAAAGETFRWWRERGNPSPLLFTEAELAASVDCFPMEFTDLVRYHRMLVGRDVVSGLQVDLTFYRAQVEHELRAKLFRLRQKAAGMISDPDLLRRLLADSVSTFCVLIRHALALHGQDLPPSRRETIERAKEQFGIDPAPFLALLDVREQRVKPRAVEPVGLLSQYLTAISSVIDAVDRLEKS